MGWAERRLEQGRVEAARRIDPGRRPLRPLALLIGAGVGAALAFFLDPVRGRSRRIQARDQIAAAARDLFGQAGRLGSRAASDLAGQQQRLAQQDPVRAERLASQDDVTIAQRVVSQVFRDRDIPHGAISVNVEDGVVVLRGELERQDQIDRVESAAKAVDGVLGVHSLLHLSGTPAPNTAEARGVGA